VNTIIEKTVETPIEHNELLAAKFPAKYVERLKISFLFKTESHKYYRMDYYNTANDNHIDRSYFVTIDIKTNDVLVRG